MSSKMKFDLWCKHFLDPDSPTRGNATKTAIFVYKSQNYHTAGSIGHQNYKKLQLAGLALEELEGRGIADWYRIAAAKAVKGSYEQTIDFMQVLGIIPKDGQGPTNQINQQFNFSDLAESFRAARIERGLPIN